MLKRKSLEKIITKNKNIKLISLTAGAGCGKTWAAKGYLLNHNITAVWISITSLDNYLSHFKKKLRNLTSDQNSDLHFLVFDDCHLLNNDSVLDFLARQIAKLIPEHTIFLLSRTDTLTAQLKKYAQLPILNLTEKHLVFSQRETAAYFSMHHLPITYRALQNIHIQTGGWPIAVYLTVLSLLKRTSDPGCEITLPVPIIHSFIQNGLFSSFTGSEQLFLIKLSIFERIPAAFLEEIYGLDNFRRLSANLIIRYDPRDAFYYLHPLYRSFLSQQFQNLDTRQQQLTYQLAGDWNYSCEAYWEALQYYQYLEAITRSWDTLQKLFHLAAPPEVCTLITRVLNQFPEAFMQQTPLALLYLVLLNYLQYDLEAARRHAKELLAKLESDMSALPPADLYGEALLIQALICLRSGDLAFEMYMSKACTYLPDGSRFFTKDIAILRNHLPLIIFNRDPVSIKKQTNALLRCEKYFVQLLHGNAAGLSELSLAQSHYYQTQMEDATLYARAALDKGRKKRCADIVGHSCFLLVRIFLYKGDLEMALRYHQECRTSSRQYNQDTQYILPDVVDGFFFNQMNDVQRLPAWLKSSSAFMLPPDSWYIAVLVKAQHLLGNKQYYELLSHTKTMEARYQKARQTTGLLYVYIFQALAFYYTQKRETAALKITAAYKLADHNQILSPFLEQGHHTRSLFLYLKSNLPKQLPADWVDLVLTKATTYAKMISIAKKEYALPLPHAKKNTLLTKKELELLNKLSIGFSREEIADYFQISHNTVKSSLKNIYSKLGAANSSHAISLAIQKGLLNC